VLRVTRCEPRELPVVNPFTIVALPDTQYYSQYAKLAPIFAAQTQWVVNNRVTENVAFVTHPGDIVQNGATGTNQNLTGWHGPTEARRPDPRLLAELVRLRQRLSQPRPPAVSELPVHPGCGGRACRPEPVPAGDQSPVLPVCRPQACVMHSLAVDTADRAGLA
jgi:hypothetical protein